MIPDRFHAVADQREMTGSGFQSGEMAFHEIFEGAPVAIWDEDLSGVRGFLDELAAAGHANASEYLSLHPEAVRDCVQRVRIRHVNRIAREFYGADSEEQLIASLPSLFDDEALEIFRDEVLAFHAGRQTFDAEFSVTTLAGERRRVLMNVSHVPPLDWSRVVVAFTDVTERRRLEQAVERSNEKLLRLNQNLEQFAYAAAHDLREPLRTIGLYTQLLRRHQPPVPGTPAESAFSRILDNARRMETLVEDLLRFARAVEVDADDPEPCASVPDAVLQEVLAALAPMIHSTGAEVRTAPDLPAVAMESVHLGQVLQNLVANAIKYRSPVRSPQVCISCECSGGWATFCVSDNGVGIRSDYHQQIFGIFKRLHGLDVEGNGIGLALCRRVVEGYGGRIWVESEPDRGASFYFTAPLSTI